MTVKSLKFPDYSRIRAKNLLCYQLNNAKNGEFFFKFASYHKIPPVWTSKPASIYQQHLRGEKLWIGYY